MPSNVHSEGRTMTKRFCLLALLVTLAVGCGSDGPGRPSGPSGPDGDDLPNGSFSALIDGADFDAEAAGVVASSSVVSVAAANESGQALSFAWMNTGTGTYAVEPGGVTLVTYVSSSKAWSASSSQGSGSLEITALTANRAAGTFSFVLQADAASGATGTRTITEGHFDLTF
jgi:hypothetical protein